MSHSLLVTYWTVRSAKPPFSDAQTPLTYTLDHSRGQETFNYSTVRGYGRHVSSIVRYLKEDNGRILGSRVLPSGSVLIVYRPGWERGPHAAPHGVVIPPCYLSSVEASAELYRLTTLALPAL